jgi:hypothetical protein
VYRSTTVAMLDFDFELRECGWGPFPGNGQFSLGYRRKIIVGRYERYA